MSSYQLNVTLLRLEEYIVWAPVNQDEVNNLTKYWDLTET